MPCPISACGIVKVTLPSWSMRTKAFGAKSAFGSAAKARGSRGTETPSTRPPPAATVAFTIARRVNVRVDEDRVMGEPPSGRTRGLLDGRADAHVGAAAANVSCHRRVDVSVVWVGRIREQRGGGHDLSGLAVAALHHFEAEPRFLDFASRLRRADALDGRHLAVADRADRQQAGTHRPPVDMHRAGAALRDPAAEFGSREADHIPQGPEQRRISRDVDRFALSVDLDGYRHARSPIQIRTRPGRADGGAPIVFAGYNARLVVMLYVRRAPLLRNYRLVSAARRS